MNLCSLQIQHIVIKLHYENFRRTQFIMKKIQKFRQQKDGFNKNNKIENTVIPL